MRPTKHRGPEIHPFVQWLLRTLLGEDDARVLISELLERYDLHRETEGPGVARKTFRWDVRRGLVLGLRSRLGGKHPATPMPRRASQELVRKSSGIDGLVQDVRFGIRSLRRRPLFSFIAILVLSLGIGSATAVFSIVEGVLLRPLPFPRPQELVTVTQTVAMWQEVPALSPNWDRVGFNQPAYRRWREGQSSFTDVAIYRAGERFLMAGEEPTSVPVGECSSTLFSVLGVSPVLGRTFLPEEDGPAATRVTLLSLEVWKESFGSDPAILRRSVVLDGETFTIIGVLPAGFRLRGSLGPSSDFSQGFWVPTGLDSEAAMTGFDWYQGIGRLRAGAAMERAEAEATALIQADPDASPYGARVRDLTEEWTGSYQEPLALLLAAVLVLLLIACANVAALLIGETPGREVELATRRALGAGGRRLGQQLLTESLLLGVAGSGIGVLFALVFTRFFMSLAPPIPRLEGVGINAWVLLFSIGVGILTSLAFGMAPVVQGLKRHAREALVGGGRIAGKREGVLHHAVVSGEIALTVVLLVGGGLLARSLFSLMDVDTGFRQEGLVEARVSLPSYLISDSDLRRAIYQEMVDALRTLPGVIGVSGTTNLPFSDRTNSSSFRILGRRRASRADVPHAQIRWVHPDYFRTMGIPLLGGRSFSQSDRDGAAPVAVISQALANRFWPDRDPIGARLTRFDDTISVIGVVGDVRHESLKTDPSPTLYLSALQASPSTISFIARTTQEPEATFPQIREALRRVHPETPILSLAAVPSLVADSAQEERFRAVLLFMFGLAGTFLAGAGVFGITARAVEARRGEMGIRIALGAQDGHLLRLTMLPCVSSGLVGLLLGTACALAASRLLARFLFGVNTWDPTTYAVVALLIPFMCLVAAYVPSRRIQSLEPVEVLRSE